VVYEFVVCEAALVCNRVPPVLASYHLKVPAVALLALSDTVPAPQREPATTVGAVGTAFTVAMTAVRGVLSQVAVLKVT
jgi:hypothetical protein